MKGQFKDSVTRSEKLKMAWANKSAEEKAMISAKRTGRKPTVITWNQFQHMNKVYKTSNFSIEEVCKESGFGREKVIKLFKEKGVYSPKKRGRPSNN